LEVHGKNGESSMADSNKKVVVGVTGGIAAYKSAVLVRELMKNGFQVRVIMTKSAQKFITPLTFKTLTTNEVVTDMWQETEGEVLHIWLAQWADLVIIAPATANTIGKIANGIADDFLTTFILATRAPTLICPAMNTYMFQNAVVQENIGRLRERGYHLMSPGEGSLACGMEGEGRLSDLDDIVEEAVDLLTAKDLKDTRFLITASRTEEYFDPVRCLTNRSSGKMGFALATAARRRGAKVTLVTGPTYLADPRGVDTIRICSGAQMFEAVRERFDHTDALIKAAAVSDFRPAHDAAPQKMKKERASNTIELIKNPDILKEMGSRKKHQVLVGFAAETEDLLENALAKMKEKNLDFIVANDVSRPDAGFCADTNTVKIIDRNGSVRDVPLSSKLDVAHAILDRISEWMREHARQ